MGLIFKEKISQNISVAVWQISENEDFFKNSLHLFSEDEAQIKSIKLQKVRLQKWACRAALAELLGSKEIGITYTETGQPQTKAHYISFSHAKTAVAVALADIPVGIDIEELSPRILSLYPRFMSREEIAACNVHNLKELYSYWCAKEAMYKWFSKKNLDFIEDLQVDTLNKQGVICKEHTLRLFDFTIDNQIVVVCG
jgi:phosphopantetheinyl transferase